MAQLPPKSPNMPLNFPNFGPLKTSANISGFNAGNNPSWIDEFLNFSTVKRGAHRRSVSDSIAFLEAPIGSEFDALDDEQLTSLFPDDAPVPPSSQNAGAGAMSSSSTSSPSDNNSFNEAKNEEKKLKSESEEAQSEFQVETMTATISAQQAVVSEQILDPKRVKRILANRQSAQRSRVRKLQYISELEHSVSTLQNEVSALSPQVAFLDHQRSLLTMGNSHLKQRIAALAQDKIFKDAHQESLKNELERLRQVYNQQNHDKISSPTSKSNGQLEKDLLGC